MGKSSIRRQRRVRFKATTINPWAMTTEPVQQAFSGTSKIALSPMPYMAVLFESVEGMEMKASQINLPSALWRT